VSIVPSATLNDIIGYIFDTLMNYNPAIRFFHYSEARPSPVEPFLHQVEVLSRCMLRDPVRILIGDEIGLGKTITAIVLGKYLQDVERVKKTLVLVPRILVTQWVEELGYWIGADKTYQIERDNVEVYKSKGFPNGWYVISMDLLVRNRKIHNVVLQVEWDLIIVDEVHKISPQTAKKRWKYIGEELIAKHPERNVFLLSATPHKGFPDDYIARLQILDPNLKPDIQDLDNNKFYRNTWNTLVFRRMKRDVNDIYEGGEVFKPAYLQAVLIKPSSLEAEFYKEAESYLIELLKKYKEASGKRRGAVSLLVTLLAKRAFSSPASAYSTLLFITDKRAELLRGVNRKEAERRAKILRNFILRHLAGDYTLEDNFFSEKERVLLEEIAGSSEPSVDDVLNTFVTYASVLLDENHVAKIEELRNLAEKVSEKGDTKIVKLEELVKYHLNEGSKVIVFTEYADTARYIEGRLKDAVGDVVKVLTGKEASSKKEREDVEENFVKGDKYRVLVSTDVLSEGLNLQTANVLINYDLPWSLLKLEQRMGRVWRLGQKRECFIYMLVVGSSEMTTAPSRVISKLYKKLLNMERAQLGKINPILGKDVEVYDINLSRRTGVSEPMLIAEKKAKNGKKVVSETDLILASLDDKMFEEFVKWYIEAINHIERKIEEKNVDPKVAQEVARSITDTISFNSREETRKLLLSLAKILAKSHNILIPLSDGKEVIKDSLYQKPLQDMTSKELIKVIQGFINTRVKSVEPITITAWSNSETSKTYILKVSFLVNRETRYEDILGVDEATGKVLSGVELLRILISIMDKPYQVSTLTTEHDIDKLWINSAIRGYFRRKLFAQGLEDFGNYIKNLSQEGLRSGNEWNKVISFNEVEVKPHFIGLLDLRRDYVGYHSEIDQLVGVYNERKVEIEGRAIAVIMERLSQLFEIQDLHERGFPFDLILVRRSTEEPREQRIVEVKSWEHIGVAIYTDNEKSFAEDNERIGGNYWLYIVDMREDKPRILGFRRPFTTGALELVTRITKNGKDYYIYRVVREADEAW